MFVSIGVAKFEHFNLVDLFKKLHADNLKDRISFELKDQIKVLLGIVYTIL